MRRTAALVLAVPAAIALLAPSQATPAPSGTASDGVVEDVAAAADPDRSSLDTVVRSAVGEADPGGAAADADVALDDDAPVEPGASDGGSATDPASTDPVSTGPSVPPVETTFVVAPAPEAGGLAGSGPRWRYTVEVDPTLGVDPAQLAIEVRAALHDPRSWARDRTMEQVADPSRARIRVVLAPPSVVDELCGRVGLFTAGVYSCWTGRFAMLNAWRWDAGADGFPDIATYRTYLVNHEVGHGLGFGHEDCPGPQELAPVMMQQSKGLGGCVANGWPHP